MSDPERPAFGASEVIEVTSKFEADDDAFLIGGQATNFWAWFYQDKEPDLKLKGPFTSEDIDCFGTQDVARNVADALGGKLLLPEPGDHTPNTAQIVTTIHGKLRGHATYSSHISSLMRLDFQIGIYRAFANAGLGGQFYSAACCPPFFLFTSFLSSTGLRYCPV
jgi:hypothetical protein